MELVPHRVRVASCGAAHTLFLTSTGVAFACGLGSYGRLGTGARESLLTPRMLASLEQTVVVQVSAGARHSAFVTEGGQVYMAGDDGSGQCAANSHTALALRTPAVPPKFAEGTGATVLGGASGGGGHVVRNAGSCCGCSPPPGVRSPHAGTIIRGGGTLG